MLYVSRMIYSVHYHPITFILTFPSFHVTMLMFTGSELSVPCTGTHVDHKQSVSNKHTEQCSHPCRAKSKTTSKRAFGSVENLSRRLNVTSSSSVLCLCFENNDRIFG
ncbi:hypothetical protein BDR07DRAFT_110785 [Suillus spraguei]|nr:hypothetical protein BDR07DRAFT_110785 [Suillus spraguei]